MIWTWQITAIFALTGAEWVVIITAIVGTGLVGQLTAGATFVHRMRREKRELPVRERTVAAEEAEAAMRVMGATIKEQRHDIDELRTRIEVCEGWRQEHLQVCPMWKVSRGSGH